jgi:ferric-chelate reductase
MSAKIYSFPRLRAAAASRADPARPKNVFTKGVSTLTAVVRESSYCQFTPLKLSTLARVPPFGSIILILCYFGFVLGLEFTNNNYPGAQYNQARAVRAGWLAVSQLPLLALLAAKTNIVGLLTGSSYERLCVYHRWVARGLLILTTMHFAFQSVGWDLYGLGKLEWNTDTCPPTGIAAYAIVLWMNLTTLAPFRNMSYQLFVAQHIITFMGLIIALMEHLPSTALYSRVYIWITIGLYLFDRSFRTFRYLWTNISPAQARLEALNGAAVKVRLSSHHIKSWTPGSHVRLRFPKVGFWHTHPATILSTPSSHDGDLILIWRPRGWFTRRLLKYAEDSTQESSACATTSFTVLAGGPYRSAHHDFLAYHTVILIAGGSGIAFTTSILLDLAARASALPKIPLQSVCFVWMVRHACWTGWIADELQTASKGLHEAGIEVQSHIFVTGGQLTEDDVLPLANSPVEKVQSESSVSSMAPRKAEEHVASTASELTPNYTSGRADVHGLLLGCIEVATGETAVGVCGPLGLVTQVRSAVVRISDDRAVHKGTGAQGIYLHVANVDYS